MFNQQTDCFSNKANEQRCTGENIRVKLCSDIKKKKVSN